MADGKITLRHFIQTRLLDHRERPWVFWFILIAIYVKLWPTRALSATGEVSLS